MVAPLVTAAEDSRLSPLALRIFVILVGRELDCRYYAWRRVKRAALAARVRRHKTSVSRALGLLVACGYLDRGPKAGSPGRAAPTYRLPRPAGG